VGLCADACRRSRASSCIGLAVVVVTFVMATPCESGTLPLSPFDDLAEEPDALRWDLRSGGEFVLTSTEPAVRWDLRETVILVLPGWAEPEPEHCRLVAEVPDLVRTGWVIACTAASVNPQRHFRAVSFVVIPPQEKEGGGTSFEEKEDLLTKAKFTHKTLPPKSHRRNHVAGVGKAGQ
jgi:hypothetical protein